MTNDAKTPTDLSPSPRLGRAALALALAALTALAALAPATASARTTRAHETSIGSPADFGSGFQGAPKWLAVDQANGDVYAASANAKVSRFTAAGGAKNFTAGPGAGTNAISGLGAIQGVAVDNSGGPLNGSIYVSSANTVNVFAASGASLGVIDGSGAPGGGFGENSICGVAVDQSNGSVYVAQSITFPTGEGRIWRYAPSSPSGAVDDSDYAVTGISPSRPCNLAANSGDVYATVGNNDTLVRFSASDFTANLPTASGTELDSGVTAVAVDPKNGDVYVNDGKAVAVFGSSGDLLYEFGAAAYFGMNSQGIAVKSAAAGPAAKAYVADPTSDHRVEVFGAFVKVPTYTHDPIAAFGPDGSSSSAFGINGLSKLAFDNAARRLYALDPSGLYGFGASAPPAFPPAAAFSPLAIAAPGGVPGLAVDNTALPSAGNVYLASRSTDLLYGFDAGGAALAGFPVDPATSPGAPDGSPKDLCGAAVDSVGNVWVSNASTKRILKYSSAGASLPGAIDASAQGTPCQLAFDSADDLYVTHLGRGVFKYTEASGYALATQVASGFTGEGDVALSIAVDAGDDHLYVATSGRCDPGCPASRSFTDWVDEYDPAGNLIDEFATAKGAFAGVTLDPANGNTYVAEQNARRIRVFGPGYLLPEALTKPASGLANASATLNGTVVTQGVALDDCEFEYVSLAAFRVSGFGDLSSGGSEPCSPAAGTITLDLDEHPVSASATGLIANTEYRFRITSANGNGSVASAAAGFTSAGPPVVETVGAPVRTATTAQLNARLDPSSAAATYRFEYGAAGPCDSNPCASTAEGPAGSGNLTRLVSKEISGLQPNTTYHYRAIADNGNPDGPAAGEDMTVRTRASDALPTHGDFPGPPGSDRAYEQVNMPDSGGNPVLNAEAISDDGASVVYGIGGGTSISDAGSAFSIYYAERPAGEHPRGGWQTRLVTPPRAQVGANWKPIFGSGDLASLVAMNAADIASKDATYWRLAPNGQPAKLLRPIAPQKPVSWVGGGDNNNADQAFGVSADGSRVVALLEGGVLDPAHPAATAVPNLYDISAGGEPQMVSFLPGEALATCGVARSVGSFAIGAQTSHWVAASRVFFPSRGDTCSGSAQLYMRDLAASPSQTSLISGPPLSGPACDAGFVKATADAAFFATNTRLAAEDRATASCSGSNDVYRYDLAAETIECLTCVAAGLDAGVTGDSSYQIAVSEDGSHLYFSTRTRLLPGAPPDGNNAAYRIDVTTGDLAYVAPIFDIGTNQKTVALTPDGSVFLFLSSSDALNPIGGLSNGGAAQYYRYDDTDRSLVCVSCPLDGSSPPAAAAAFLTSQQDLGRPNITALADDGATIAFSTPTALLGADQNTPASGKNLGSGSDVYEWRDGRQLLVTDGLSNWTFAPSVQGVSSSGRDVYFSATAQYTPDALDAMMRLYDARIGGGIEFPVPPPPCPLEVCQGTPKGAPEEAPPGSASLKGAGNRVEPPPARCGKGKARRNGRCVAKPKPRRCAKGKVRAGKRCVAKKRGKARRANHNRRAAR